MGFAHKQTRRQGLKWQQFVVEEQKALAGERGSESGAGRQTIAGVDQGIIGATVASCCWAPPRASLEHAPPCDLV